VSGSERRQGVRRRPGPAWVGNNGDRPGY